MYINLCNISIIAGDDDEEEEELEDGAEPEEKMPTCGDYIMHFLTLVWKVVFAVIPPAGMKQVQFPSNVFPFSQSS
jgi:hypothetical protein